MEFYTDIYEPMNIEGEDEYGPVRDDPEQLYDTEEPTDADEEINTDNQGVHPIPGL